MSERQVEHEMSFTTVELAGILSCVMATLAEDKPEGEFDMLSASLESARDKIKKKLGLEHILTEMS